MGRKNIIRNTCRGERSEILTPALRVRVEMRAKASIID